MLQITEDTPPDVLAGAMDLTVHLPTGRSVKMAVERSTPMMDLLVQITTNHQLQLSNYTLQALGMAPSSEHSDTILPYKPNTPIGTLDTQHIKVVPKSRSLPVPKNVPPGHQPFESTFRLKVHLPRNQLYVTRVSRNVLLEDIMKKVCEEKNLDPVKYEFKHPGNLDEVLDPKLTLSDYQITEIYVVLKGTASLNQAFSSSDIMALRKEEERKQMHTKTGGGVFNLIFRRGKSSMGSGSISSDTRSISPTQSDDSRSVTPPAVQQQIISPPKKKEPPAERPKPPQRKRRPAPKPPQEAVHKEPEEVPDTVDEAQPRKAEMSGLTICHSRNSSDSSGYHEASVLSENCNASLPRRPRSAFVAGGDVEKLSGQHSQSTTNLSKMSAHTKSTMSLGVAGRKKKAAPPPPPVSRSSNSSVIVENPSPVVASQPAVTQKESIISTNISTTVDSLPSISSGQNSSLLADSIKASDKSFGSTDSGIAQENHIEKHIETELDVPITPPPPPFYEDPANKCQNSEIEKKLEAVSVEDSVKSAQSAIVNQQINPAREVVIEPVEEKRNTEAESVKSSETETKSITEAPKEFTQIIETAPQVKESAIGDIDWQYQLPSPPKAFRDSSPPTLNPETTETESVTDFKDSVVTSPELFEKLKAIEDSQSDKGTISDLTSTVSEEEKPLLNTLSLEHLEKRKSLVYNRELATSLKMTDMVDSAGTRADTFSSSLTQFESTYDEIRKSSLSRETPEPKYHQSNVSSHTLPNFKISTYDQPKQKIKVFEDDTIRSNTDKIVEATSVSTTTVRRSKDHVTMRKNSLDNQLSYSDEDNHHRFYKSAKASRNYGPQSSVFRSESFSTETTWSPSKPVSRSKSHLTLNAYKYREEHLDLTNEDSLSRSNSLFDVSGLQSLEVMKLIQNKLNTPTSSLENLNQREQRQQRPQRIFAKPELKPKIAAKPAVAEEPQRQSAPEKIYKYQGPPSINMGTWSERPKVPVSVKEDADYKLSNHVSSKLIVKTINNNIRSNNSIEVKNNTSSTKISPTFNGDSKVVINGYDRSEPNNVSIKVNGVEPIISTHNSGNVIIKIGGPNSHSVKSDDNQRFINHTTAAGYRKPFSNINKIQPRPHSVAFDSDFDMSRVPVVRSVELKKPFKDMSNNNNTSVTQIYQSNGNVKSHTLNRNEPVSELKNKFSNMYKSSETLYGNVNNHKSDDGDTKPVFRTNSFKPMVAPVVRGFKSTNESTQLNNRLSWNPSGNYHSISSKPWGKEDYTTNKQVPFSQSNLRRTESSKLVENNVNRPQDPVEINNEKNNVYNSLPNVNNRTDVIKPPPPPLMPKVNLKKPIPKPVESNMDPRDQLLSAIRNFGGRKGLKAVKA